LNGVAIRPETSNPYLSLIPIRWKLYRKEQSTLNIIFTCTMLYSSALFLAAARREQQLTRKFFDSILQPKSCLHDLLPPPRDPSLLTRLNPKNSPEFP